ncbi:MAG: YIP1 family protein [Clostridia bacterium]|nr:YIP1 family protein [Clostridia bacterium]
MKKLTSIICLIFVLVMIFALPINAAAPYQTYTYSINGKPLYSPEAYVPASAINSDYMGLSTPIANPSDLEVDENGNVYIADTDNNRIVVLDPYYKVKFTISSFVNENGVNDSFAAPQGVFITKSKVVNGEDVPGRIFVCDTNNNRIVTFDLQGNFLSIIARPESELFEEGSTYKPVAVAVDQYDRMYVVSSTTYQGIIVMTDRGEFTGFIGAQKTTMTFWNLIWRRFQSEEQRAAAIKVLSSEFNNIAINSEGFIYVTTSAIEEDTVASAIISKSKEGDYAPVKMLNAAGDEIMRRNGFYPPSGEVDLISMANLASKIQGPSTVVDVAVGPEKTWTIVDQKRSRTFTYDFDGNLLFAFGDMGPQLGNITADSLAAVTYQGDNMLLLDKANGTFTVFERTEYGNIIVNALRNQNERRYDNAIDDWTEILKRNSNFDAAYIGIGNALYRSGQYEDAMEYYKAAYDTENYSNAYKEIRKEWIAKYILLIPIFVIAICLGCSKFLKYAQKVNKRTATAGGKRTYGQELLYAFHIMFHPFDGFWDLKHEKRGSVRAGSTILLVTLAAFYYQNIGQGYIMNPQAQYSTILATSLGVIAILALWIVGNWCLTTLFEGEGSFKDIYIASTYALAPLPLFIIPATMASNVVLATEVDIINLVVTIGFIWALMLIFFGTMITHDYSLGKNFITTLGTIVAMVCILFVAFLFSTLITDMVSFVANIVTEIQYRA